MEFNFLLDRTHLKNFSNFPLNCKKIFFHYKPQVINGGRHRTNSILNQKEENTHA